MKNTGLKANAWYLIIMGLLSAIVPAGIGVFLAISSGWNSFSVFIIEIGIAIACGLSISFIISGIMTLLHLRGKKTYYVSVVFDYIGIIAYISFITIFILFDSLSIFTDYYSGFVNTGVQIIMVAFVIALFIFPLIWNRILIYKDKKNLTNKQVWHHYRIPTIILVVILVIITTTNLIKLVIVGTNKTKITEKNTYTYYNFERELRNRQLINTSSGVSYSASSSSNNNRIPGKVNARNKNSKYGVEFTDGKSHDGYYESKDSGKKFPFFVYDSYKTSSESSLITWYIYYVDGKIYAAVADETFRNTSKLNPNYSDLEQYRVVVSEEDKLTIYNAEKNYYVKGGGIVDTRSGMQRTIYPTTKDIYDSECMRIIVVDRVDGDTLERIGNEVFK